MTKVLNLGENLKKIAKNNYQLHTFTREWSAFILITFILKIAAMVFSIFAGYFYFVQLFTELLNSVFTAQIFAVIVLLLVEVLTALSLSKFFKFALRMRLKQAIPILFLSVFFFAVSFISSTNGLSMRQSEKVDQTSILTDQNKLQISSINTYYDDQIKRINEQITTIKNNPQGWKKSKRTVLLQDQLTQIDKYYLQLKETQQERKKELNVIKSEYQNSLQTNLNQVSNESTKYYRIVAFIMFLVFLVNGLIMFFYSKIFDENEAELATVEVMNNFSSDIQHKTVSLIENNISNTVNLYHNAMAASFAQILPITSQQQTNVSEQQQRIGFANTGVNSREQTVSAGNEIEFIINNKAPEQPNERLTDVYERTTDVQQPTSVQTSNTKSFGVGTCSNCNTTFNKKSHNHKFCSELCRLELYEKKTGKNVDRFKTK